MSRYRKRGTIVLFCLLLGLSGCTIKQTDTQIKDSENSKIDSFTDTETSGKGIRYNIEVSKEEHEKLKQDCTFASNQMKEIYQTIDFEQGMTVEQADSLAESLAEQQNPVIMTSPRRNMENASEMEDFIDALSKKEAGQITIYTINADATVNLYKFDSDGAKTLLYHVATFWNDQDELTITNLSCSQVKEWNYTEKGWFVYHLYVPEYPEVTEVYNDTNMFRVKEQPQEYLNLCNQYLEKVSYGGNNLFRCNWSADEWGELDCNSLYDVFYRLKNHMRYQPQDDNGTIEQTEFERMLMTYLPISTAELEKEAVRDESTGAYKWISFYKPDIPVGTSIPEITDIVTNDDGTLTLSVDAVCEMEGNDQIFSHELTVKLTDDGIKFLGNHVMDEMVPEYVSRYN